jgi:Fe-S-cluster containining protein
LSFNHPKNVRFKCTKCALCCGDTKKRTRHILLLEKEIRRISETTSKPVEEFSVKIEGCEPYLREMKKTGKEGKCFFLEDNLCTIYGSRPLICRFYPFQLSITENGKYKFSHTAECPGIGQGKKLREDYFENLFQQACEQLMNNETKTG